MAVVDNLARWDLDILGPGTYTSWDDVPGGPNETKWDLLLDIIGRGFRVVWQSVSRSVDWQSIVRRVRS